MNKILFATHNQGKVRELKQLLVNLPLEITSAADHQLQELPETHHTFLENALEKARAASSQSGLPAIADDSGLVIPALNGEPGIFSARYSNQGNQSNIEKVVEKMQNETNRQAFFVCLMVYLQNPNDPMPLLAQGLWQGEILHSPRGEGGFGYDPIFWVPQYQCSAAELTAEEKNQQSHRGQALRQLLLQLQKIYSLHA